MNPFSALFDKLKTNQFEVKGEVISRFSGPDTIKAVSLVVEHLERGTFQHHNKNVILEWSNHIDVMIKRE